NVLGQPDWARSDRWSTAADRYRDRSDLDRLLGQETARRDGEELMSALQSAGVPAGLVRDAADLIDRDPQLAHRGHWVKLNHAEMGETIYNAPPYRFSKSRVELRTPAPLLGEHTREVLQELLGIGAEEGEALIREGVLV